MGGGNEASGDSNDEALDTLSMLVVFHRTILCTAFLGLWLQISSYAVADESNRAEESLVSPLSLATLFRDGCVLQQGSKLPVWGKAPPLEPVTVEIDGQSVSSKVNSEGKWRVDLEPLAASFQPKTLTVKTTRQTVTVENILIGEVWLCSGQSNMAMGLHELPEARDLIKKADNPNLRMFRVPEAPGEKPWETTKGQWLEFNPQHAGSFSAFAYYFASSTQEELNAPVGIVLTAWGGSTVASWISEEKLRLSPLRENMPLDVLGWRVNARPSKLFNGMLNPLIPFSTRGVIWYQGESDAEPFSNPFLYRLLFVGLIQDWRKQWNKEEWPFYFVQLPAFQYPGDAWPVLRESQAVANELSKAHMMVSIDLGQPENLHPTNKDEFARRMARIILAQEYGIGEPDRVPLNPKVSFSQDSAIVDFGEAQLSTNDGQPPKNFKLAGRDQRYFPAQASIRHSTIHVTSEKVKEPVALRYAWDSSPEVNIILDEREVMAPFRTDKWFVTGSHQIWKPLPPHKLAHYPPSKAKDHGWAWSSNLGRREAEEKRILRPFPAGLVQILVAPEHLSKDSKKNPIIGWEEELEASSTNGITFEITAQVFQASDPFRGLDIHVELPIEGDQIRTYQFSIQPMRLNGFSNGKTYLLADNLDNVSTPRAYRIAITKEGRVQLYMGEMKIGLLPGTIAKKPDDFRPRLQFGKLAPTGEMTANIFSIALDLNGAYSPAIK